MSTKSTPGTTDISKRDAIDAAQRDGALTQWRDINTITAEIRAIREQAQRMLLDSYIEMGRRLCEAKEMLGHGEWGAWLRDEAEFSQSSANYLMRIFKEFGDPQGNIFGASAKSQALGNLTYTQAVALLALPSDEIEDFVAEAHEVDGQVKTVDEMSTRELERAVRERKEALEEKAEAEEIAAKWKERYTAQEDLVAAARTESIKTDERVKELERQLEELRSAESDPPPEPDEDAIAFIRAEAAAAAKKEAKEKLKKKIAKAEEDKLAAEAALEAAKTNLTLNQNNLELARAEGAKLRKSLDAANSGDTVAFKVHFENAQSEINKMLGYIAKADGEQGGKFTTALAALCRKVLEGLGG